MSNYRAGKFAEARVEFLELAELGDGASQFNLGAMSLRGEGTDKDQGAGIGWLRASLENGHEGITEARLQESEAKLTEEQRRSLTEVLARYGRDALLERVLPRQELVNCDRVYRKPRSQRMALPDYPPGQSLAGQNGVVIIEFTVGIDGLARDPHVLASAPPKKFDDAAIRGLLRSRFTPAELDSKPVEGRYAIRTRFVIDDGGGVLWNNEKIDAIKQRADAGQPDAQFVAGLLGVLDDSLKIPAETAQELLLYSAQSGYPDAQYWIAGEVTRERYCRSDSQKNRPWLQQAARGKLIPAKIALAYELLADPAPQPPAYFKELLRPVIDGDNGYALKHAAALLSGARFPELRDAALALQAAQKLDKLDADADPQVSEAIAAAHAANGDFKRAARFQQRALKTAAELKWNTQRMQERLTDYTNNKTWAGDLFAVPPAEQAAAAPH
jgi:TonB family protein